MLVKETGKFSPKRALMSFFVNYQDVLRMLHREIVYSGAGWYSMDDNKVYLKGKFPTYSRIKLD